MTLLERWVLPARGLAVPRRAVLTFALGLGLAGTSCTAQERRAPPRAPALAAPNDAIPAELDVVLRVDLARIRAGLGPEAVRGLRERAFAAAANDASDAWVADAIERSDVAIVAFRPELGPGGPDNVIVLKGGFSEVGPRKQPLPGWDPPVDLGANVRRYDRRVPGARSSAARLYAFGDEQLVFVSVAAIDSVEAVLERGRSSSPLRPEASGLLSFQARVRDARRLLGERFPLLAGLFGDARGLSGNVDVGIGALEAEFGLELTEEAHAVRAAETVKRLVAELAEGEGKVADIARGARVEAAGRFAMLRVRLGREALGAFRASKASE